MRSFLASLFVLTAVACGGNNPPVQCKISSDCDQPGFTGGSCDEDPATGDHWCSYSDSSCPSGQRWASVDTGDGLAGQCEVAPDGGLPPDARPVDAQPPIDANTTDAMPGEIVTDDQAANVVIGQPDFTTNTLNTGGVSAQSLNYPTGLASDGTTLWANDAGNARALGWSPIPTGSHGNANHLLGKTNFADGSPATGVLATNIDGTCCGPAIAISGTKLVIADTGYNRVLVWNALPTTNGQAADLVLGQGSFSTYASGNSASQMYAPEGVWTDGTRLVVADAGNNRVLIWNTFPTTTGKAADIVLGQGGFGTSTVTSPPTASSMKGPIGVFFDGTHFFVADSGNNRVMVFDSFPNVDDKAADVFLGQPNSTSSTFSVSATGMGNPHGVVVAGGTLFVSDYGSNRVLVFDPIPTTSGASARHVLGQPDLNTSTKPTTASQTNMYQPSGLVVVGNELFVADSWQHRILRFALNLP